MVNSSVPSASHGIYTGPITRLMAKRRQIEAQASGAGFQDQSGQSQLSPQHLRPRPTKINTTDSATQGPKSGRRKK
ncbi:hypothetical protein SCP_0404400 [Sparassis crispa]|uniref:Uncharacterized protein n=1 Tax=Sparassis crispa TaxID=139825 RepID=A0A401GIR4_9APHY|nr:hypothetical protein SCP_0404400 [Sparassis crispa]GBE82062.1 hypothetical protein SCP_0404400 [Sparassis crispa]